MKGCLPYLGIIVQSTIKALVLYNMWKFANLQLTSPPGPIRYTILTNFGAMYS